MDLHQVSVSFVCQAGDLEIKALLLAASLREQWGGAVELIAAVPAPEQIWGGLAEDVRAALKQLDVNIQTIHNPWQRDYPIGNKVAAAQVKSERPLRFVLDTDILCCNAPNLAWPADARFLAKPTDYCTWGALEAEWQRAYEVCETPEPTRRVLSTVSDQLMWPYFNSGVVAWRECPEFADTWIAICRRLDANPAVENKRPWVDQIGLPIAFQSLGGDFACLSENWNFPAHAKTLPDVLPSLIHYHWPEVVAREWRLSAQVERLSRQIPALRQRLESEPKWRDVLHRAGRAGRIRPERQDGPDFLITGLPRSGTSYLCRLLHEQVNTVVLNEPAEIFPPFSEPGMPHGLLVCHGNYRRDISLGRAVLNKVDDEGRVIQDTAARDERRLYHPTLSADHFALGSKNTIAYLSRLDDIRALLPNTPIFASIRHPCATIASWKRSFSHLNEAAVAAYPVGGSQDPRLSAWQSEQLDRIEQTRDLIVRRALLWRYWALHLFRYRDQLLLLRLEDVLKDPNAVVTNMCSAIQSASKCATAEQAFQRKYACDALDPAETKVVRDLCAEVAPLYGYSI